MNLRATHLEHIQILRSLGFTGGEYQINIETKSRTDADVAKFQITCMYYHYQTNNGRWLEARGLDMEETFKELKRMLLRDASLLRLEAPAEGEEIF